MNSNGQSATPSKLNVSQAARAVGKARSTINKHIKEGKLTKENDGSGNPVIDVSELQRVYGEVDLRSLSDDMDETVQSDTSLHPKKGKSDSALATEVKMLREQMAKIDELKAIEVGMLNDRIEELRRDRDEKGRDAAAREEDLRTDRDAWKMQATNLLTDQSKPEEPPKRERTFLGFRIGRKSA